MAADKAEKSSKMPDRRPTRENSSESSGSEVIVLATPQRPAQLAGESQGGTTIILALKNPAWLRLEPDLAPRVTPPWETEPAWQLPASTTLLSLDHAETRPKRKRQGTIRYKEGREDGYIGSVGLS